MRLGQLSRKVNVKPTEILSYLKNEFDVELGSHLNTKVEDELADKVINKFAKPKPETPKKEVVKEIANEIESSVSEPIIDSTIEDEVISTDDTSTAVSLEKEESTPTTEFQPNEEVDPATIQNAELIKAPKVELTGPKVIGKIELPPSLEEQMVEVDGVMMSKAEIANRKKEERKAKREKREERKSRSSKSVRKSRVKSEAQIEQIKRDKAAEEMAKRLERREKRIASKRKEEKKVKPTFVPKPKKKKSAKAIEIEKQEINKKPEPTTWYGKLWKWFNT
ncbi:MAG: hypothetical protein ACPGVC_07170 [Salibacteraceae bacterium]